MSDKSIVHQCISAFLVESFTFRRPTRIYLLKERPFKVLIIALYINHRDRDLAEMFHGLKKKRI